MTITTPYHASDIASAVARGLATARDRPQPAEDANCSPQKYAGMSRNFRASAWEHLRQGDLPQASNKGWGLVAETVKAISAHYGSIIHSHRAIIAVIERLARLADAGDGEIRRRINDSFQVARNMHTNFYENELPDTIVRDGLQTCEELSDRLYLLFWPEGAAFDGNI